MGIMFADVQGSDFESETLAAALQILFLYIYFDFLGKLSQANSLEHLRRRMNSILASNLSSSFPVTSARVCISPLLCVCEKQKRLFQNPAPCILRCWETDEMDSLIPID